MRIRRPAWWCCAAPAAASAWGRRFPRYYDIICRLACGPLSVSLEQTMLSGTLSHPNVAHALSYRLMAHTSRMFAVISCVAAFTVSDCAAEPTQVTILATNDIHGGSEPNRLKDGTVEGAMSQAGYDVAITGNHDYDFGPVGWLEDEVTPTTADQDPRGALKAALSSAQFPLISSNTFLRSSLRDALGNQVQVEQQGCDPIVEAGQTPPAIDWTKAASPDFLKPYLVKEVGGVRVAVIGIDNMFTPTTTTPANVSDLCFEREADAYLRVRAQLDGQADVFVLLIHDGNTDRTKELSTLVETLMSSSRPTHGAVVDAVISGHTH